MGADQCRCAQCCTRFVAVQSYCIQHPPSLIVRVACMGLCLKQVLGQAGVVCGLLPMPSVDSATKLCTAQAVRTAACAAVYCRLN